MIKKFPANDNTYTIEEYLLKCLQPSHLIKKLQTN